MSFKDKIREAKKAEPIDPTKGIISPWEVSLLIKWALFKLKIYKKFYGRKDI